MPETYGRLGKSTKSCPKPLSNRMNPLTPRAKEIICKLVCYFYIPQILLISSCLRASVALGAESRKIRPMQ